MGYEISGGGASSKVPPYKGDEEKLTRSIVIEEVKIIEVPREVIVPVLVEKLVEQTKYITKEAEQIHYTTKEVDTTKYNAIDKSTIKYNIVEENTIKYVAKDIEVEKPVIKIVEYEKPVIKEKVVEIVTPADVNSINELKDLVIALTKELKELKAEMDKLRSYKLVEQVVEAPRIQWINTPVERVIWKDVERNK